MKRRLQFTSSSEPLPNITKLQVETSILKNKYILKSVDNIMCYSIYTINKIKPHHQNNILVHLHQPQTKLQIYYWVIYCPQLQFLKIQLLFNLCISEFFNHRLLYKNNQIVCAWIQQFGTMIRTCSQYESCIITLLILHGQMYYRFIDQRKILSFSNWTQYE